MCHVVFLNRLCAVNYSGCPISNTFSFSTIVRHFHMVGVGGGEAKLDQHKIILWMD